jgi:hypothetical protein
MSKDESDRLVMALLVLGCAAIGGMLLGSWQLVLYPSLLIVGVLLAMSVVRRRGLVAIGVPVGVTALLIVLFAVLHVMGADSPSGTGSFLGWDPMTALYLFGLGPAILIVGLLFALTDRDHAAATDEEIAR